MTRLGFASFWFAVLTLAACTQGPADPTKASADKPATVQSAPTTPYPYSGYGDHSGGGGGGEGGGGGGY